MSGGTLVDIVIVLLALMFAINGYRQGFVVGAMSFLGFFGGALIGVNLAPYLIGYFDAPLTRVIVALVAVFGLAVAGQAGMATIGARVRGAMRRNGTRTLDHIGGAIVSLLAVLLVAWMVATPLAYSSIPGLAAAVRNSSIVHVIDDSVPDPVKGVYDALRRTVDTNGFPDVFGGLGPTNPHEVAAPNEELKKLPAVVDSQPSVLKVLGEAPRCDRRIEGSGWVFAPERVMTNAHVVAGTESLVVETADGHLPGRVVVYDPSRDLAVIYVPGLDAPVMDVADGRAEEGEDAIVLGYPMDGPYTVTPARIRSSGPVRGPNIYDNDEVTRDVYALRAHVISGNSGGPLISADGDVYGVIFAAAVDDKETGYALTMEEVTPVADAGRGATDAVGTQDCT
ncbi:MarP family serine protease [Phytomonospora endophytica]|uniref:S1-C subfamily serine protease n=1 Tax=Phytomonospora endophytica TaxID=714109 RepID=A0A841FGL4_9ACTN|nr:MarP family serine protease [Phytomonospora endophytica]MBB6035376.1 S1-C subfamily serine protease [Phytomonospora endophytica]GIG63872.1 serine protease [Phytomonospora endophytica]